MRSYYKINARNSATIPFIIKCLLLFTSTGILPSITRGVQIPELVTQTGHSRAITSLAFSQDGKLLVSRGEDETLRLWDVSTGSELQALEDSNGSGKPCFIPNSKLLASSDYNGSIKLWNLHSGVEYQIKKPPGSNFALSADCGLMAIAERETITLWSVDKGSAYRTLPEAPGYMHLVTFSPDGKIVAGADYQGRVTLWDLRANSVRTVNTQTDYIGSLTINPDNKSFAIANLSSSVTIWDIATGAQIKILNGKADRIRAIAYSPLGDLIAGGGDNHLLRIWDTTTSAELAKLQNHTGWIRAVAFSPDGKLLASGSEDRTITLWDVASRTELREFRGRTSIINAVAFHPDGNLLASGGDSGSITLWDARNGGQVRTFRPTPDFFTQVAALGGKPTLSHKDWHVDAITSVAFSPNGKLLVAASNNGAIMLWEVNAGVEIKRFRSPGPVTSLAFNPQGTLLASTDWNNLTTIWNIDSGTIRRSLRVKYDSRSTATAFSYSSKGFGIASSNEALYLWRGRTGFKTQHTKRFGHYTTSAQRGASNKYLAIGNDDSIITLINLNTGSQRRLVGHREKVTALAFSSDGAFLASGSLDHSVKIWDTADGRERNSLIGHSGTVTSIEFGMDDKLLASSSVDGSVKLWSTSPNKAELSNRPLLSLVALEQSDWIAVTPDGIFDGSPAAWTQASWRLGEDILNYAPAEAFFNEFFYPGLLSKILSGERLAAASNISAKDLRQPEIILSLLNTPVGTTSVDSAIAFIQLRVTDSPPDAQHPSTRSGAMDVKLFRNGSLVKAWQGDVLHGNHSVTLEAEVEIISGENRFTAYAFNRSNVKSRNTNPLIIEGPIVKLPSTMYIMTIGIDRYQDPRQRLKFAVADAKEFGTKFAERQRKLGNYDSVREILLTDEAATKSNILIALRRLSGRLRAPIKSPEQLQPIEPTTARDAVILYFAGHGVSLNDKFYYLTYDVQANSAQSQEQMISGIKKGSISDEELASELEPIKASRLLMIIDACDSGQVLGPDSRKLGPMNLRGMGQLAFDKGMYVLTAAQQHQPASESPRLGHGVLTYTLIDEALEQSQAAKDNKGRITERRWLEYAARRVPELEFAKLEKSKYPTKRNGSTRELYVGGERVEPLGINSIQRPRLFYSIDEGYQPLIISQPTLEDYVALSRYAAEAQSIGDRFFKKLTEHRFDEAYRLLSPSGRATMSPKLLEEAWGALEQSGEAIISYSISDFYRELEHEWSTGSNPITLIYQIESRKGYAPAALSMSQFRGTWLIDGIQIRNR